MPSPPHPLTPELRRLIDRAAAEALADLQAAIAHRPDRPTGAPLSPQVARLVARLAAVDAPLRDRLRARAPAPSRTATPRRRPSAPRLELPEALRAPRRSTPRQASGLIDAMELTLTELHCIADTRAVGADRMIVGHVQTLVDTSGDAVEIETRVIPSIDLGKFHRGDRRVFQPPRVIHSEVMSHPGRVITTTVVLAEHDLGGLDLLLRDLADGVSENLILGLIESVAVIFGVTAGATFLGTLGGVFGPVGAAAGITLGGILGGAIGEGLFIAFRGLLRLIGDDPLDPVSFTIDIPEAHPLPRSATPLGDHHLHFTGAGGAYEGRWIWRE